MEKIPFFKPRDILDNMEVIKELHYNKLHRVKEKISKKFTLLNELGIRKCISCKTPIGLTMGGFIVLVLCDGCFENPKNSLGCCLRKEWINKENK